MNRFNATRVGGPLLACLLLCACSGPGGDTDREHEALPEETVFDPLTSAPGKVQSSVDDSLDLHERALDDQIDASEGVAAGSAAGE
jgi:hypothetical protein